jgi:hypothetical protein
MCKMLQKLSRNTTVGKLKPSNNFLKNNWWTILLSLIIFISLIFSYFSIYYYWKQFRNSTVSGDTQKWADFGSYIGGTLNTLFALINVCVTIWLTIIINKLASKNTDKQIEAERKISTIQLRHEALKEFRSEFEKNYAIWQSDIHKARLALNCQDPILNFSTNYEYLFDNETIEFCNSMIFFINDAVMAMKENNHDEVERIFNNTRTESWNLFARIGQKVIQ